jgi:hypothetical protein
VGGDGVLKQQQCTGSRERVFHQRLRPWEVQVLFLFGCGLAPAPGRASPVIAGDSAGWLRVLVKAGVWGVRVGAEPGVKDKTHTFCPKTRQLHATRGSAETLFHSPQAHLRSYCVPEPV